MSLNGLSPAPRLTVSSDLFRRDMILQCSGSVGRNGLEISVGLGAVFEFANHQNVILWILLINNSIVINYRSTTATFNPQIKVLYINLINPISAQNSLKMANPSLTNNACSLFEVVDI